MHFHFQGCLLCLARLRKRHSKHRQSFPATLNRVAKP